jgi:hypothetical protein
MHTSSHISKNKGHKCTGDAVNKNKPVRVRHTATGFFQLQQRKNRASQRL